MSSAKRKMIEDRALRDAAFALVKADVAHLRNDLTARGIGQRFVDRISGGASDVLDEAVDVAESHRGVVLTLVAAIMLWLTRNPLLALFGDDEDDEDDEDPETAEPEGD
ncbi:hypothetical protein [Pelagerythrobacter sp.]|uniref:hypothetical protein n=1 Tax=Pelagerythrobacter sp. TaxID=2800702 RepID=UPI0035AE58D1